ncbi:hypothetical protein K466DRAFT_588402 [Polyporus arcularius HHB13444]|uniref:Uncharacterized protein n=1 Tax=Polyporus arcularius HHB13444 TaxID=1314778 RepID=A0A5C3P5X2_9APHY|nr:hypothetical protein K466DRAFT_588402 [Polyporus arcularius HHB13444]
MTTARLRRALMLGTSWLLVGDSDADRVPSAPPQVRAASHDLIGSTERMPTNVSFGPPSMASINSTALTVSQIRNGPWNARPK